MRCALSLCGFGRLCWTVAECKGIRNELHFFTGGNASSSRVLHSTSGTRSTIARGIAFLKKLFGVVAPDRVEGINLAG